MSDEKRVTPFGIAWRAINGYMALAKKTRDWDAMEDVQELMGLMASFSEKQSSSASKRWNDAPHTSTAPIHRTDAVDQCTTPMPKEGRKESKKEGKNERTPPISSNGHHSPGDAFAFSMAGGVSAIEAVWVDEYTKATGSAPTVSNGDRGQIRTALYGKDPEELRPAFKAFLQDKWVKDQKMRSIVYFCKDPSRWINAKTGTATAPRKDEDYGF